MKAWIALALCLCACAEAQTAPASLTVTTADSAHTVYPLVPRTGLWKMHVNVQGKPIELRDIMFSYNSGKPVSGIELYNEFGALVGGPVDAVGTKADVSYIHFMDAFTMGLGTHTLVLRGNISNLFDEGEQIRLSTTPYTDWKGGCGPRHKSPIQCLPKTVLTSPVITVIKGYVEVSENPDINFNRIVVGGSVNSTIAAYDFTAHYQPAWLPNLGLKLGPLGSPDDIVRVTVWDGTTMVGQCVFMWTSRHTTVYFVSPIYIPMDARKTLIVRTDLAQIGIAESGRTGHQINVDYDDEWPGNSLAVGQYNGAGIPVTGHTYSPGVIMLKSYPTFQFIGIPDTGLADERLIAFSVTAHTAGMIGLGKFSFAIEGTHISDIDATLYAYTDSTFSQPVAGFGIGGALAPAETIPTSNGLGNVFAVYPEQSGTLKTLEIPAGATYYFMLRGLYSSKSYAFVKTQLLTEEYGGVIGNFDDLDGKSFILWTPNSYTTTGYEPYPGVWDLNRDWLNSFGLPLLWSEGFTQTRAF